jgi:tetratricopeptide (TPR) repeat protein
VAVDGLAGEGRDALAAGRLEDAVAALTAAMGTLPRTAERFAEVAVGLSDALWWLGRVDEALAAREQAYEAWRGLGDDAAAARAAAWLAREYAAGVGNTAASQGWLARAETLVRETSDPVVAGWVALTRAALATAPAAQAQAAHEALAHGRAVRDGDLEVLALGRLGLAMVGSGRIDEGLRRIDEAMAAATGGDAGLSTLAALCCDLVLVSELSGEIERFSQWNEIVESLAGRYGHPPLVAFCATCCAEAFAAGEDWQKPSRLASSVTLAERYCRRFGGDALVTGPAIGLLVDAHLAAGDRAAAGAAASRLDAIAVGSGYRRTAGQAALARGRVAAAAGDTTVAISAFEEALDHLSAVAPGMVATADAHLELARMRVGDAPQLAAAEAKSAVTGSRPRERRTARTPVSTAASPSTSATSPI